MSFDLLITLIVFAAPGALAIQAWDWGCHRTNRSLPSVVGHGIIVSLFAYALVQLTGAVDLGTLVNSGGRLSLETLLSSKNIGLFLLMNIVLLGGGVAAGRWLPALPGQLIGKSFFHSVWGEVLAAATAADRADDAGAWILLRTKSGWEWFGRPHLMPPEPRAGDFIALKQVQSRDFESSEWLSQSYPVVLIPFGDVEFIQLRYQGAPSNEPVQERHATSKASSTSDDA